MTSSRCSSISSALFLLTIGKASACSACVQLQTEWYWPFVGRWMLIFMGWLILRWVIRICAERAGVQLPIWFTRRPWQYFVLYVLLTFLLLPYLPFLLMVVPVWIGSLRHSHRQALELEGHPTLKGTFLCLQWWTYAAMALSLVFSYATFNNLDRLSRFMQCHVTSMQVQASDRMVSLGKDASPRLTEMLRNADLSDYQSRQLQRASVRLFAQLGDKESIRSLVWLASQPSAARQARKEALKALSILDPKAAAGLQAGMMPIETDRPCAHPITYP